MALNDKRHCSLRRASMVWDVGTHLWVTSNAHGELHRVATYSDELLDIARSRVTRTFTETECATYRIDPCPTRDEVRAG